MTKLYYRVRSVLLSDSTSALTLSPGRWVKDSETETITDHGETYPVWDEVDPMEGGAEFDEIGGKLTELRIDGTTAWKPGDHLTVTVEGTTSV